MGSIKACLDTYSNWFGQKVNFLKLVIIFSKKVNQGVRSQLANYLGIQRSNRKEKYLGILMASGRDKKAASEEIIEKVRQRLQGWKIKTLSQESRTILVSSVASSLLLPKQVCKKFDAINRNFWWGSKEENKRVASRAGIRYIPPKSVGGLGIKKIEDMNKALVAKMTWEVASNVDKM